MPPKKDDAPDNKRRYLSSAARKEEILDAALVEFADRTYNAVSMERLAECAGLSKAGIYAHFKSKEEIFTPCSNATKQICDFQGWLPDEDLTLPELVDVYLDRLYATFSSPATMSIYRLLLAESARTPELVQRWHNEVAHGLKERAQTIIQRNIERGIIRPGVLTEHFFPLALAPAVLWLSSSMLSKGSPSISLVQLRDAHRQLLLELLQPQ
jgi:AcrR family transcriptional regulator